MVFTFLVNVDLIVEVLTPQTIFSIHWGNRLAVGQPKIKTLVISGTLFTVKVTVTLSIDLLTSKI